MQITVPPSAAVRSAVDRRGLWRALGNSRDRVAGCPRRGGSRLPHLSFPNVAHGNTVRGNTARDKHLLLDGGSRLQEAVTVAVMAARWAAAPSCPGAVAACLEAVRARPEVVAACPAARARERWWRVHQCRWLGSVKRQ